MNISEFSTVVFDCDGVILNSNKVKTDAFYRTALPYGKGKANILVQFHKENGGVSRYEKFQWFIDKFSLGNTISLEILLSEFQSHLQNGLANCEVAKGLNKLRENNPFQKWMIVSGGDQEELRHLFHDRGLAQIFDSGIFGRPGTKFEILEREIGCGNLVMPAIFLGDSKLDYESAVKYNLDFCFLSDWTEFKDWKSFCDMNNVSNLSCLSSLETNSL